MAFVLDDIAVLAAEAATEAATEAAEGAEAVFEEVASQEFSEASFNGDVSENALSSDVESVENKDLNNTSETEIEKEFAPENFNTGSSDAIEQSSYESSENIERTSTFEDQTVDNFELESMRPEIEDRMCLGQEHDGGTLRYNMEQAMDKKSSTDVSNAHHIVGRDTPQAAKKLEEFGIDRNDPANGIFLPNSPESPLKGAVHGQGRHGMDYSNEVEQRFAGVTTREEALEVLQSIKEDLYSGELYVHKDISANK